MTKSNLIEAIEKEVLKISDDWGPTPPNDKLEIATMDLRIGLRLQNIANNLRNTSEQI